MKENIGAGEGKEKVRKKLASAKVRRNANNSIFQQKFESEAKGEDEAKEKVEEGVMCKVEADGLKVRQISEPLLRREEMLIIPFFKKHCQDDNSSWIIGASEKSTGSESKDTNVNENIIMNVN